MNSTTWDILFASALALFLLAVTTALHYEALLLLARRATHRMSRNALVLAITTLVVVHLIEIGLYAISYAAGAHVLGLGTLRGRGAVAALDYFYFAAETYSTVGYGDLVPTGSLRLVASVEPLNGLLLLAWSGAFLFHLIENRSLPRS